MFSQLKQTISNMVYGPSSEQKAAQGVYEKKDYYTAPQAPVKTFDTMWTALPKINPRVLLGGHGMGQVEQEIVTGTANSWDPRGEHESVKRIQAVVIPGQLVNDRAVTAAVQRAGNRDLTGIRTIQV